MKKNNNKITLNNRHKIEWEEDLTVDKILKKMNYSFKMIVVKVNGKIVKKKDFEKTKIPPNADVRTIHLVSGG